MSRAASLASTTILKTFPDADEVREFTKGKLEVVRIAGRTLARVTYQPGWRWSEHVGSVVGTSRCSTEHLGVVVSGHATAAFADGTVYDLTPGTVFYIPPEPHDSWVVGDEPFVALHVVGAEEHSRKS